MARNQNNIQALPLSSTPRHNMSLQALHRLIGATAELDNLRDQARGLAHLQKTYVDNFPGEFAELTKTSRVGYLKGGALYVVADDAATAAKLRHVLPRLAPMLKLGAKVIGIKVVVQVKNPRASATRKPKKRALALDSIEKFSTLADGVKNPALKLAITNFVNNQKKSGN